MLHTKIIDIKKEKILIINAEKFLKSPRFGASIFFTGTVRDINENKKVTGITYDSHDQLVIKSFKEIYDEVNKKFKPPRRGALLDVRDDFTLSPSYMRRHYTVQNPFAGRRRGRGNKINTQKKRKKKI